VSDLSQTEITAGLREALNVGVERAISLLGQDGGFLNDATVRIPMPDSLQTVERGLRAVGQDATEKTGVTSAYKQLIGGMGFLNQFGNQGSLDLDAYVTRKTLDGLFLKLADEERLIRENPVARSTDLLKKVFGGPR